MLSDGQVTLEGQTGDITVRVIRVRTGDIRGNQQVTLGR